MTKTPSELAAELGAEVKKVAIPVEPARGRIAESIQMRGQVKLERSQIIFPIGVKEEQLRKLYGTEHIKKLKEEIEKDGQPERIIVRDEDGERIPPFVVGKGFAQVLTGLDLWAIIVATNTLNWEQYVARQLAQAGRRLIANSNLVKSPFNPRIRHEEDWVRTLKKDILERGQLEDILVRELPDGKYEVGDGYARMLTSLDLWAKAVVMNDDEWEEFVLANVLKRKDLNWVERLQAILASVHLECKGIRGYPGTPEKLLKGMLADKVNGTDKLISKFANNMKRVLSSLAKPVKWVTIATHDLRTWELIKGDDAVLDLVLRLKLPPSKAKYFPDIKTNNLIQFEDMVRYEEAEVDGEIVMVKKLKKNQLLLLGRLIDYIPEAIREESPDGVTRVTMDELVVELWHPTDKDKEDIIADYIAKKLVDMKVAELLDG